MRKIVAIVLSLLMILTLPGCVGGNEIQNPDTQYLVYVEHKVVTLDGVDMVAVIFDYTNNGEESRSPVNEIAVDAFQNGTKLGMYSTGGVVNDAMSCANDVQGKATARIYWLFDLIDGSTVSIEVSDGQKFSLDVAK